MEQHTDQDNPAIGRHQQQQAETTEGGMATWPLGRLLAAAAHRVEQGWNARLGGWEVDHTSLPVLLALGDQPRTQTELAIACADTEQSISRILTRLERSGHVARTAHATDRRKRLVTVTDRGRSTVAFAGEIQDVDRLATSGLTTGQLAELRALLTAVACLS